MVGAAGREHERRGDGGRGGPGQKVGGEGGEGEDEGEEVEGYGVAVGARNEPGEREPEA